MKKKILISVLCIFIACVIGALGSVGAMMGYFNKGNSSQYSPDNSEKVESSLEGKTIIFLGSSVTYGYGSKGKSFVDYMVKQDGIIAVKEAKSGTTLVDDSDDSYISRMKTIDKSIKADLFVCQLSTNDATKEKPFGFITKSFNKDDFDTHTITGAMEYIIAYAQETWGCPVMFYTNTGYDSENYKEMVRILTEEIQRKWTVGVINLWNNNQLGSISDEERAIYMVDAIHPTMAGYRDWWLPVMRPAMEKYIGK